MNTIKFILICLSFLLSSVIFATMEEAKVLLKKGELSAAKVLFEAELKEPHINPVASSWLARIAWQDKDFDIAEKLANKAVKKLPESAEIQSNYGIIMANLAQTSSVFSKFGYAKKTLSGFSKAVSIEPENIIYRQNLMAYHLAAPGIAGGDKEIALEQANAINELDIKQGLQALLSVYMATENEAAIQALFAGMTEEQKQDPDILLTYGLYQQTTEKYDQALIQFQHAITYATDQEEFQSSKYGALYQLGRTSVLSKQNIGSGIEALRQYIDTAPELDGLPSKEWAEFRLANLIEAGGNKSEAVSTYTRLAQDTNDENLKSAIKKAL